MTPTCDICGKHATAYFEVGDWNGETGCHISCEEARSGTRGQSLVERCPDNPSGGGHEQASLEMLEDLGANEDSNLCAWCLEYDVCEEDD